MTAGGEDLIQGLVAEILRDAHRYAPGLDHRRPTLVEGYTSRRFGRERWRDAMERGAARLGFTRRHFDPPTAAARLARLLELSAGLEATQGALADARSRQTLRDLLKLRVLGPYHAPLRITPQAFRALQARAERTLRIQPATFDVSDPWFSPLSLYRVPAPDGSPITLHSHSVDVAAVLLLEQYSYRSARAEVRVKPGDVVLDIGGCWGDTALYFASLAGPTGKVYTFEFDPQSLAILRANLELNPELAERIEVVELAAWERSDETVAFVQAGRMTSVVGTDSAPDRPRVDTVSLDDFVRRANLDRVGFVKIDVEGAEQEVLRGAAETIATQRPGLAVAVYHRDDDLVRIPAEVRSLGEGYRLYLETFSPVEEETVLFASSGAADPS
jgi:FkbM family methyltransferase